MDEPTIDCYCGAEGALEVQLWMLDDLADWKIMSCHVRCLEHGLNTIETVLEVPRGVQRMVVMPLG